MRDPRSGDGTGLDDPLMRLRPDRGDAFEVGVVVEHDDALRFGRGIGYINPGRRKP